MMETIHASLSDKKLFPQPFGVVGKIWTIGLILLFAGGVLAYIDQIRNGLGVTAMRDYVSWGIYISNFVFFVAISLVGSLISALLHLSGVKWGAPLNRIAEIIALASILFASIIIVVDMGRPDRIWHLFAYGRIQSPIIWDVLVISTYFLYSFLLLYFPLLPDLAIMASSLPPSRRQRLYRFFSLGWTNTPHQRIILKRAVNLLALSIVPLAFGIHTVTSWLFATTYRPGWDSTNFGPYFVSGAFLVGAAAVAIGMYVYRDRYALSHIITDMHFNKMGKLIVLLGLLYLYFNINEYLVPGFKMKAAEAAHLQSLFTGDYAVLFWSVIVLGMILPILVLIFPGGRKPFPLFVMSLIIVVGAWFKRYIIVTPTLLHPFLPMTDVPEAYKHYFPTWIELLITAASVAGALLIITFFTRYIPVIPISEHEEEPVIAEKKGQAKPYVMLVILFCSFIPFSAQSQQKVRMDLDYYQEMGHTPYLKTKVRTREQKQYVPVQGVIVNLFLQQETKWGMMGNVTTDAQGEGTFLLPDKFWSTYDSSNLLVFTARILNDPLYADTRKTIEIQKAGMSMQIEENDKQPELRIGLYHIPDSLSPISDQQVEVFARRLFGLLPQGDGYHLTDEQGEVIVALDTTLPGNVSGELQLVARLPDNESYGNLSIQKSIPWHVNQQGQVIPQRSLWGSRGEAPIWLLVLANVVLIGFWLVLLYLFFQLYRIRSSGYKIIH